MEKYQKKIRILDAHFGEWVASIEFEDAGKESYVTLTCEKYPNKSMAEGYVLSERLHIEIVEMISGVKEAFINSKKLVDHYEGLGFGVAVEDNTGNWDENWCYNFKKDKRVPRISAVTDYDWSVHND